MRALRFIWLVFFASLFSCGGRTGPFWPASTNDASVDHANIKDFSFYEGHRVTDGPLDMQRKDGPIEQKDGLIDRGPYFTDTPYYFDLPRPPDGFHPGDLPQKLDFPYWPDYFVWPDVKPPPDKSLWPDLVWPKDTWPKPDGYTSGAFGCIDDYDCFGLRCCATPWGVKLCLTACEF